MAINAPIQGTAADIVRIAMVRISDYLKDAKLTDEVKMLLQIHDELVFEIKDGAVEKNIPALLKIMHGVLAGKETFGVPMEAEVKTGPSWGDLKKFSAPNAATS
jgi:DNA polymerase-1